MRRTEPLNKVYSREISGETSNVEFQSEKIIDNDWIPRVRYYLGTLCWNGLSSWNERREDTCLVRAERANVGFFFF